MSWVTFLHVNPVEWCHFLYSDDERLTVLDLRSLKPTIWGQIWNVHWKQFIIFQAWSWRTAVLHFRVLTYTLPLKEGCSFSWLFKWGVLEHGKWKPRILQNQEHLQVIFQLKQKLKTKMLHQHKPGCQMFLHSVNLDQVSLCRISSVAAAVAWFREKCLHSTSSG